MQNIPLDFFNNKKNLNFNNNDQIQKNYINSFLKKQNPAFNPNFMNYNNNPTIDVNKDENSILSSKDSNIYSDINKGFDKSLLNENNVNFNNIDPSLLNNNQYMKPAFNNYMNLNSQINNKLNSANNYFSFKSIQNSTSNNDDNNNTSSFNQENSIGDAYVKFKKEDCKFCPPSVKKIMNERVKVPVYIPIPVFTYYQIPVLHHYPLNQIVRQIVPVPYQVPVEHKINKIVPITIPVEQKIIVPQAVPYGVKVPVF